LDFVIWVEFLSEFTKSTSYGFRRFFDSSEIRASKNGITAATSSGEEDVVVTASLAGLRALRRKRQIRPSPRLSCRRRATENIERRDPYEPRLRPQTPAA
jgi:hypothetical protein